MNKNYNNNNYNNNTQFVHNKCFKCHYNGHIASNCPFKDRRYQFELTKMFIMDCISSQWTNLEINQYYLQKVFKDFPTVKHIRDYLQRKGNLSKKGMIKNKDNQEAKVLRSKDGSSGFEFLRYFAQLIDKETAEKNKELEEKLKLQKKCPHLETDEELNLVRAISGSFKVSEPEDTRKANPSKKKNKVYKETDFLTEEGYRNYLINDDLSALIPEKIREGFQDGMRGFPGTVTVGTREAESISNQKDLDKINVAPGYTHVAKVGTDIPASFAEKQLEVPKGNKPGSEYKETVKVKEQQVVEENKNVSTKILNASGKPVAFNKNSPWSNQIKRELDRLNEILDNQEIKLKELEDKLDKMNYDDPDYEEVDEQLTKEKRSYKENLNKYNILVEKFS